MVQFFQGSQRPSAAEIIGSALGQGLGGGFQQGMNIGLSTRINKMLQDKEMQQQKQQMSQQGSSLAQAIGKPELASVFGSLGPELSKVVLQQFGAENLASGLRSIAGISEPQQQSVKPSMEMSQQSFKAPFLPGKGPRQTNVAPISKSQQQKPSMDEIITKAAPKDQPALIKAAQEQKKINLAEQKFAHQKEREKESSRLKAIESEEKAAKPFMEEIMSAQKALPDLSASIDAAEQAIKSGDLSGFGRDYWAQKLNIPQLTTAKGKQLSTAVKNFMTQGKDIFGSRVTNYDVQLLENMFPRVGESKWAGLAALEMQKFRRDLQQEKVSSTNAIREELGRIPRDIDLRVNKKLTSFEQERRDALKAKLEFYAAMDGQKVDFRYMKQSIPEGEVLVIKNGKPVGSAKKEDAAELKKQGYEIR